MSSTNTPNSSVTHAKATNEEADIALVRSLEAFYDLISLRTSGIQGSGEVRVPRSSEHIQPIYLVIQHPSNSTRLGVKRQPPHWSIN